MRNEIKNHDDCPNCGKHLNDLEFDLQKCSRCGYDCATGLIDLPPSHNQLENEGQGRLEI